MMLKFVQTRIVKSPARGHATDAGIDFCCPSFEGTFIQDVKSNPGNENVGWGIDPTRIIVPPGENVIIPSGIKVEIPYGYMGLFMNKSGVASKSDVLVGAQTIDTFYSGEVHIDLHNVGNKDFIIEPGQKLAQMALVPVLSCDLTQIDEDMLYDWMKGDSYRNEGGFGSTGK